MEASLIHISPLIVLAAAPLLLLLILSAYRDHMFVCVTTVAALIVACYALTFVREYPARFSNLFVIDAFGVYMVLIMLLAAIFITLLTFSYLEKQNGRKEEFYVMLLLGTLGSCVLAWSNHFISLFLGLEILSVALYVMCGYLRDKQYAVESSIKYLVLAGSSTAFLLMGMAFIYAETGMMDFRQLAINIDPIMTRFTPIALAGTGLLITGVGFKLAVVPFHLWTPDVYQGAPVPTTAFIATLSKGAVLALWFRAFGLIGGYQYPALVWIFSGIAALSMFGGNVLALRQKNIKRLLAYSSIAHMGYLMVAFIVSGSAGMEAISFYLWAYFITILGALGVVAILSGPDREAEQLQDYQGLFWRRPWLATVMSAMMLSLAGIPLTAGFMGKYYILTAGVGSGLWALVIILVVSSVVGLYYYLRVIVTMFRATESGSDERQVFRSMSSTMVVSILMICLIWFGISPGKLAEVIEAIAEASLGNMNL